jgi:hypothetical protein
VPEFLVAAEGLVHRQVINGKEHGPITRIQQEKLTIAVTSSSNSPPAILALSGARASDLPSPEGTGVVEKACHCRSRYESNVSGGSSCWWGFE